MYYLDSEGKRVYTLKVSFSNHDSDIMHRWMHCPSQFLFLINESSPWRAFKIFCTVCPWCHLQKETPTGKITESAHPARFSPDDKFSRQRISCKKRFGIYMPQTPQKPLWGIILSFLFIFLGLRGGLKDVCVRRFHDKINLTPIHHHLIDMMLLSHSTENDTSQVVN